MSVFFAFLHHAAAFALVAVLAIELVLSGQPLTTVTARKLRLADLAFGVSAGVVLTVGLLRVFCFEKGADYYFHSVPFIAKLSMFVLVGLLSIYPTVRFVSWRTLLKQGRVPALERRELRVLRAIIYVELGGALLILLFAAMMARGIGRIG